MTCIVCGAGDLWMLGMNVETTYDLNVGVIFGWFCVMEFWSKVVFMRLDESLGSEYII